MKLWDEFLKDLEKNLSKSAVDKWLRPLKVQRFDACNLYLDAESSFHIAWFEEHVRAFAKKNFCNNNAHPIKIHFSKQTKQKNKKKGEDPPLPTLEIESTSIDPSQTFSNFLFDHKTAMTVEFCKKLSPGAFNPLFLYGGPGTGKTHLLNACANKWKNAGLSVFYVHAETFTEHVVKAIRSSQMQKFRGIYRNQDVLIIDDIHCLARRAATQEELFHTFNTLHTSGRQIVLASHLLPSQMEEIEPRLISRFEWGIMLEVAPLSSEKMKQVLKNKANLHHFPLSDSVAELLQSRFCQESNTLMRALDALFLRHKGKNPITLLEAQSLLTDLLQKEEEQKLTPEKILSATSAYFGIRKSDILGKSRARECTVPRKIAMYLCRKRLHLPYLTIGKFFDRDHSTVMTSIEQIEKKSGTDEISAALDEVSKNLVKP
ncbi:MAG: chromosomal replication initiator protein DnaA [Simkaniaceae bacterium]|nr:chromosomal replication initiator protein DnaA [Candidatus Sacchlamyda saccharinae]